MFLELREVGMRPVLGVNMLCVGEYFKAPMFVAFFWFNLPLAVIIRDSLSK